MELSLRTRGSIFLTKSVIDTNVFRLGMQDKTARNSIPIGKFNVKIEEKPPI